MTLTQLMIVLAARWRFIVGTIALFTVCGFLVSVLLPSKYTAVASVLVDIKGLDPVGGGDRGQIVNQTVMTTQADMLTSERVARRVVEVLKLTDTPAAREAWEDEADSKGDFTTFLAQSLLSGLKVTPSKDSSVLEVAYTARNPAFAARVANTFVEQHMQTSLDMRVEPARRFSAWFDERTKTLRNNVETAQARLSEYQRKNGVLGGAGQGQIDVENSRLAGLTAQLVQIQALRGESKSRMSQVQSNIEQSPEVLNSPVIATLRTEIARAEVTMAQVGRQLGANHPEVIRARDNLASLRQQLQSEMRAVARTAGGADEVNQRREAELIAAVEQQKQRVLQMTKTSSEMAVLTRDVEAAQRAFDAAATRQGQTALESQMQQTNVFLLSTATEPGVPSSPRIKLNTLAAAMLGLLIGLGGALLMEARAPKVRNLDDLSAVVGLPVLAVISRAKTAGGGKIAPLQLPKPIQALPNLMEKA